jgi:DDE superfamily endonuclease
MKRGRADIKWEDRLSVLNHCTHFPYFVSFFLDTVPVACFGGEVPENYQPKYAGPVLKMQVCCDALGRIVFFSGPHPGSRADSTLWKRWGPKVFLGDEVGLADGAYSGNYRLIAPFRKPPNKALPVRKDRYNRIHSFFRARQGTMLEGFRVQE